MFCKDSATRMQSPALNKQSPLQTFAAGTV